MQGELQQAFQTALSNGHGFKSIVEARAMAGKILGQPVLPGTTSAKLLDETFECAVVQVAREIAASGLPPRQIYQQLVNLYERQPTLGTRTSTSISQQAYSTPVPMAYVAAQLAGITETTSVYEPTAGNGALLLSANQTLVMTNELNPDRAAQLAAQGFKVTSHDALHYLPSDRFDVVITNPPFGRIGEESFNVGPYRTREIDHAIALKALEAMRDDGRAVLILGGKRGTEETRSDKYHSQSSRAFFFTLFNRYNVVDHFGVDGDLYRRQGAGFPIDVLVIAGRGKSPLTLPAAVVPRIYNSYEQLGELLEQNRDYTYDESIDRSDVLIERSQVQQTREYIDEDDESRDYEQAITAQTQGLGTPERSGSLSSGGIGATGVSQDFDDSGVSRTLGSTSSELDRSGGGVGRGDAPDHLLSGHGLHVPQDRSSKYRSDQRGGGSRLDGGQLRVAGEVEPTGDLRGVSSGDQNVQSTDRSLNPDLQLRGMASKHDLSTPGVGVGAMENNTQNVEQPALQVRYVPKSEGQPIGTLVPRNMAAVLSDSLDRLQSQVGSLDEYVQEKLGYTSREELWSALAAEQVDAAAMAIHAIDHGSGAINGDQTGIGKGRVAAAIIRYAERTGRTPIFVTCKPVLYADMGRDLEAVGMGNFRPFATNTNLNIPMPNGTSLSNGSSHKRLVQQIIDSGSLPTGFDGIFTTYSQLQTVKGENTERRDLLRAIAPRSILILDESHEAGGASTVDPRKAKGAEVGRADFTRELVNRVQGVLYSSATYAKNPVVMSLYSRTDMGQAVGDVDRLIDLVERGGVPMQQGLATMLSSSGQYIRRERSYEGVSFEAVVTPVDQATAENVSRIMRAIMDFEKYKSAAVRDMSKELKAEARSIGQDNATGEVGASSTNFTSLMHNVIDQMLLSLKAEPAVQKALEVLRIPDPGTGLEQKPLITVANTMASFISNFAEENKLSAGDSIDLDFGELLERYLVRSRDVRIKDAYGVSERRQLTDDELGYPGVEIFESVQELIRETDFSAMPISPIDYMKARLSKEGYSVGEITGRQDTLDYTSSGATYEKRTTSKAADIETVKSYNRGDLDVIILNRSGSTGISLHASREFRDQRKRHMIVAQPERNINEFLQMLGRIHRTGQVETPNYSLLCADIPAEKRPGAVLAKKMASLNATTTAARTTSISIRDVPDFMNEYGDLVVRELMENFPEIHAKLSSPLGTGDSYETEGAISKVTGRIPLLPIAEQESLYNLIESEYTAYVERQEALGESILEAETLDLDAYTIGTLEVVPATANSNSPFASAVTLEVVDAKTIRKPFTSDEVVERLVANLELPERTAFQSVCQTAEKRAEALSAELEAAAAKFETAKLPQVEEQRQEAFKNRLKKQLSHVTSTINELIPGTTVQVVTTTGNFFYGVVGKVWTPPHEVANPVVPGNWRMSIMVADPAKELVLPFSQINQPDKVAVKPVETDLVGTPVLELFDQRQGSNREERQLFTGNILRAFDQFKGKLINFTDAQGDIRQGVITNKGYDFLDELEKRPVVLPTVDDVVRFIEKETERRGQVKTYPQAGLTIKAERRFRGGGGYELHTAKAKDPGAKFYLNRELLAAIGTEFVSSGDVMVARVTKEKFTEVLDVLAKQGIQFAAFDNRDVARKMLDIKLPSLDGTNIPRVEKVSPEVFMSSEVKVSTERQGEVTTINQLLPANLQTKTPDLEVATSRAQPPEGMAAVASTSAEPLQSAAQTVPDTVVERVQPTESIIPSAKQEQGLEVADSEITLDKLRDWYRATQCLQKSEAYLDLVVRVAENFKEGKQPVKKVQDMMGADLRESARIHAYVDRLSRYVLSQSELCTDLGNGQLEFSGSRYSIRGNPEQFTVERQSETVLSIENSERIFSKLTIADGRAFEQLEQMLENRLREQATSIVRE
jgi:C-terminal domain on Strawberry notch homologue/P-loop containing NTP hydrolase pore-1